MLLLQLFVGETKYKLLWIIATKLLNIYIIKGNYIYEKVT